MAGLLDTLNPDDPASLALLTADSEPVAPAPQTMADTGPSFLSRVGSGFSDVVGGLGQALGGGLSDEVTGSERAIAGPRALLNFGLTMLANSGPSYTPRNFGQIIASGLAAAGETNQLAELNAFRRSQAKDTLALRKQQADSAALMRGLAVLKYRRDLKLGEDTDADIDRILHGGGTGQPTPGGGGTLPPIGGGTGAPIPAEYDPYIKAAAAETGVPEALLRAQLTQESGGAGYKPDARGAAGEIGPMQIKPSTAQAPGGIEGIDPAQLTDPKTNILFGARYLRSRVGKDADFTDPAVQAAALRAYNGGGDPNYVANVFRYLPTQGAPGRVQTAGPGVPTVPTVPTPSPTPSPTPAPAAAPGGATQTEAETGLPMVSKPATPPAAAPGATAAAAPRLTDKVIVPKPDNGDLAAQRAEADQTFRAELAAARRIPDAQPKAAAVAAARDKLQTRLTAITDEVNKRNADWQVRQGTAENEQRIREEQRAQKVADDEKQRLQEIEKLRIQHQAQADLENLKMRGTRMTERLKETAPASAAARSMLADVDQLETVAPAIMAGGPDPIAATAPWARDWLRTIGAGTKDDTDKWRAQDVWQAVTARMRIFTQQDFKGAVSDQEGALIRQTFHSLSQDPQNIPLMLGLARAVANRTIKAQQLREDYASDPANDQKTGGMEPYVNERLGQSKANNALPPSLFEKPPELLLPKVKGKVSPEEEAAAAQLDAQKYQEYESKDHPVGVPFLVWGRQADAKSDRVYRVPALRVILPDGRIYTQQFPPRQ